MASDVYTLCFFNVMHVCVRQRFMPLYLVVSAIVLSITERASSRGISSGNPSPPADFALSVRPKRQLNPFHHRRYTAAGSPQPEVLKKLAMAPSPETFLITLASLPSPFLSNRVRVCAVLGMQHKSML